MSDMKCGECLRSLNDGPFFCRRCDDTSIENVEHRAGGEDMNEEDDAQDLLILAAWLREHRAETHRDGEPIVDWSLRLLSTPPVSIIEQVAKALWEIPAYDRGNDWGHAFERSRWHYRQRACALLERFEMSPRDYNEKASSTKHQGV